MSVVLGRDDNSPELGITFPLSLFSPSICPTDFPFANLSLCLLYMKVMLFEARDVFLSLILWCRGGNNKKLPCQTTTSTYFIYNLKRERRR